jgi:DNA-binding XRE family transcriptional regulator
VVARKRRRETQEEFAERIGVSRTTLVQMERGSLAVALGNYASALWVLGMAEQIAELADPSKDVQGQVAERDAQPERVRSPRPRGETAF